LIILPTDGNLFLLQYQRNSDLPATGLTVQPVITLPLLLIH